MKNLNKTECIAGDPSPYTKATADTSTSFALRANYAQDDTLIKGKRKPYFVSIRAITLALGLFFTCLSVCNAADDRDQPVQLEADKADLNQTTGVHTFTGNVSVIQGATKLLSHHAVVKTDSEQKLERAIAYGDKKTQAHFNTTREKGDPPINAYANMITYLPKIKRIILNGNALVRQGTDQYRAPEIIYDIEQRHVVSQADPQARISIIIHPNLHKKAKP